MEIGVQEGSHSRFIVWILQPSKHVCVDTWEDIDWSHKSEVYYKDSYKIAQERLGEFPCVQFVKESSQTALPKMEDDSFDFIYIDGDHSTSQCENDIRNGIRLVRNYGILGGHDHGGFPYIARKSNGENGVVAAVNNVFDGYFVDAHAGDWWVVVLPEMKQLIHA